MLFSLQMAGGSASPRRCRNRDAQREANVRTVVNGDSADEERTRVLEQFMSHGINYSLQRWQARAAANQFYSRATFMNLRWQFTAALRWLRRARQRWPDYLKESYFPIEMASAMYVPLRSGGGGTAELHSRAPTYGDTRAITVTSRSARPGTRAERVTRSVTGHFGWSLDAARS